MQPHSVIALLAGIFLCASAAETGILYLGDSTFDKFVDGTRDVLVKFDREKPSGPSHEAFKDVAQAVVDAGLSMFLVGVPINNNPYNKLNQKLAKRYKLTGLTDTDFPRFKLFKQGIKDTSQPLDFFDAGQPVTAAALRRWAMENTGTYIGTPGQVKQLDSLVASFMAAPAPARQQMLETARATAAGLDTSDGPDTTSYIEYYLKTMQRVLEKGDSHITTETGRLKKMAGDKSIAPHKRDVFRWRLSILSSFAGKGVGTRVEL